MKLFVSRESVLVYQQKWLPTHYTVEFQFQAKFILYHVLKQTRVFAIKMGPGTTTQCHTPRSENDTLVKTHARDRANS